MKEEFYIEKENKLEKNCKNCFLYKSQECNGICGLCEDYKYAPEISNDEKFYWPQIGDASRFRKINLGKTTDGYSIIYIN